MLVASLQIKNVIVLGPGTLVLPFGPSTAKWEDSRLEPNVQDVLFFHEFGGTTGAFEPAGKTSAAWWWNHPSIPSFWTNATMASRPWASADHFAASLAVNRRDGHAPGTLAGNAPVGAAFHHVVDAVLAPRGNPFHLLDLRQALFSQVLVVQLDEPLGRSAENDGILGAPAMGIAVLDGLD